MTSQSVEPRILAVTVRYRMPVSESRTLRSIAEAMALDPSLSERYGLLLWDNSPAPLAAPPVDMIYHHDPLNSGITGAFNASAVYATEHSYAWILLLDQDSDLPLDFLRSMANTATLVHDMPEIAAIAPNVYVKDFLASPHRVLRNRHVAYPAGERGIAPGEAVAINSGSMLRVHDLLAVGGYHPAFQLEYSDWYIFHQLYLAGKKVWRAADIRFQHEMTVMDYDRLQSVSRYRELLDAEEAYTDLYRDSIEGALQTVRLFARSLKQRLRLKNPEYSKMTMRRFVRRLFSTRAHRIKVWNADMDGRRNRYTMGSSD